MPLVLGIVGAVAAVGSTVAGAVTAANGAATQHAAGEQGAQAQQGIANAQRAQAVQDRAAALQFAAPTAQEISAIGDRLQQQSRYQAVQEASLQRDEKILGALDPALVTAGQQANNLMQGKEASILAPMKQQQDMQRKQLQARLSAQLGPGYETSSVGQQALQQFDMQASMGIQQAQMQSFNQVSQFLGFNLGQRTAIQAEERQGFRTGSEMSAETLHAMGSIQSRQENAILSTSQQMVGTAGNEFAGQAARARAMQGEGQSQSQVGGAMLGAGLGSMGGAISGLGSALGGGGGGGSAPGVAGQSIATMTPSSSYTMPKFGAR